MVQDVKHRQRNFACKAEQDKKKKPSELSPAEQLRRKNLGIGGEDEEIKPKRARPKDARHDAAHNEEDFDSDQLGLLMDGTKKSRSYK